MTTTARTEPTELNLHEKSKRPIAFWLLICCCMIYAMVVIGGLTRLTNSGLSMVEWKPILGVIPPLRKSQWEVAFGKYKRYPEYKVRRGMTLSEFKQIYLVEYFHRIFGRLIGLVFAIPLFFFWIAGRLSMSFLRRLIIALTLGGAQGLLGWYMVKSGLVNMPHVSAYRLTAHLMLAVFLFLYVLWLALDQLGWVYREGTEDKPLSAERSHQLGRLRRWSWAITVIILVMISSGGMVAGTRSGFAFNTWPLMVGQFVPEGLLNLSPWYSNFVSNSLTIQFTHRSIAYLLCLLIPIFYVMALRAKVSGRLRVVMHLFLGALILQVTLGITTLLYVVPVSLAAAHQGGALLLLTCGILTTHLLKPYRTLQEAPVRGEQSLPTVAEGVVS